jgi:hypothetical protein
VAEARGVPEPDSAEGPKEQAAVRVPTTSEPQDIEVACSSRARVCSDRADGRQDGPHHRPGQGPFRDDDDGGLLQHEAACLLPENGDCSLLTSNAPDLAQKLPKYGRRLCCLDAARQNRPLIEVPTTGNGRSPQGMG